MLDDPGFFEGLGAKLDKLIAAWELLDTRSEQEKAQAAAPYVAPDPPPARETWDKRFTPAQWRSLQLSPLWMLKLIGEADHVIDTKETQAFARLLKQAERYKSFLVVDVFSAALRDLDVLMSALLTEEHTPQIALREAGELVEQHCPGQEALDFKLALLGIGGAVARASGEFLKDKVSVNERLALQTAAEVLGLDRERLERDG